jgi:hypothetical protein
LESRKRDFAIASEKTAFPQPYGWTWILSVFASSGSAEGVFINRAPRQVEKEKGEEDWIVIFIVVVPEIKPGDSVGVRVPRGGES